MRPSNVFDGYMHRPYNETLDGWMETQPRASDYPCVEQAESVLRMFTDLQEAHRRIWQLQQELKQYKR